MGQFWQPLLKSCCRALECSRMQDMFVQVVISGLPYCYSIWHDMITNERLHASLTRLWIKLPQFGNQNMAQVVYNMPNKTMPTFWVIFQLAFLGQHCYKPENIFGESIRLLKRTSRFPLKGFWEECWVCMQTFSEDILNGCHFWGRVPYQTRVHHR